MTTLTIDDPDAETYSGPTMKTTHIQNGRKIYRLADDVAFNGRLQETTVAQRDPMVAALFGTAKRVVS